MNGFWDTSRIREYVWDAFESVRIIPDRQTYKMVRTAINKKGRFEMELLRNELGHVGFKILKKLVHSKYPEDDLIRILGFGHQLTKYMALPVIKSPQIPDKLCSLGARANLIVSIFDHMVDSGIEPGKALPDHWMETTLKKKGMPLKINRLTLFPENKIILALVQSYIFGLQELMTTTGRYEIFSTTMNVIKKMYKAEISTLKDIQPVQSELNRKSALPFVVMGLPVWFYSPDILHQKYILHFKWLYHFGLFFGMVDDLIDLREDIKNNHPNQFKKSEFVRMGDETLLSEMVQNIINKGNSVKKYWEKAVEGDIIHENIYDKEIFSACVVSWLGGCKNFVGL